MVRRFVRLVRTNEESCGSLREGAGRKAGVIPTRFECSRGVPARRKRGLQKSVGSCLAQRSSPHVGPVKARSNGHSPRRVNGGLAYGAVRRRGLAKANASWVKGQQFGGSRRQSRGIVRRCGSSNRVPCSYRWKALRVVEVRSISRESEERRPWSERTHIARARAQTRWRSGG